MVLRVVDVTLGEEQMKMTQLRRKVQCEEICTDIMYVVAETSISYEGFR